MSKATSSQTSTTTTNATAATTDTNSSLSSSSAVDVKDLDEIQDIIDISADRLEGLRTQCATSATLTQQEIRSLESKLVRMFSDLLLKKARLNERIPANGLPHTTGNELKQWLRVVGLSPESLNACLTRIATLEQLLEQSDDDLKQILGHNPNYREEEVRRLTKAMQNLKKYKDFLSNGEGKTMDNEAGTGTTTTGTPSTTNVSSLTATGATISPDTSNSLTEQLFWDSWDRHHHRGSVGNIGATGLTASPRPHRSANKQGGGKHGGHGSNRQSPAHDLSSKSTTGMTPDDLSSMQGSTLTLTLTPSPPNSPFTPPNAVLFNNIGGGGGGGGSVGGSLNGTPQRGAGGKFTGTPPPLKKHQTLLNSGGQQTMTPTHNAYGGGGGQQQQHETTNSIPIGGVFPKNKYGGGDSGHYQQHQSGRTATYNTTDPSPDSYSSSASSDLYIENNNNANNSLHVPNSPAMPPVVKVAMKHNVSHRFNTVIKIRSTCDLCLKPMFLGLQCRECKYRCHRDCEAHVPPSCGLPKEYVNTFKNLITPSLQEQMSFPNISAAVTHQLQTQAAAAAAANTSPNLSNQKVLGTFPRHQKHDSSSPGSSCNSSSPSSPALFNLQHHGSQQSGNSNAYMAGGGGGGNVMSSSGGASSSNSSNHLATPSALKHASQFNFPEVTITASSNQNAAGGTQTLYSSQSSNASDMNDQQQQQNNHEDREGGGGTVSNGTTTGAATTNHHHHKDNSSLASSITISSSNCNSVSLTSSLGGGSSVSSSIVSATSTSTFYQRKLSSAGVDKRPAFTNELSDTHKSNDSDKTVSLSGSTSASTDSDRTPQRLDSTEDGDSGQWPRQNSLSLKEWDIPYGDLRLLEQIGRGRFGTVHRAHWHGDVAVKLLKEDYLDDEHMLEAFKAEVANFKKTRHENLVLFMGACMKPPYLAIVTSLCKGNTLYTYIHQRREKFTINKTTLVAQQISQGMGYLHARGICHKDLRTKNIFLENGKVIITDFGLFSSTKLLYCDIGLGVPNGWLCYLAPELMQALMPCKPQGEILPFSSASDVYSFGTVWYELLCGEFPFKMQPHESIIWQVGRGMKQTLANLQTSRDVKDILMLCWKYNSEDRPDFPKLLTLLERLPKKRLARSPSHPVQLSRSAESVF